MSIISRLQHSVDVLKREIEYAEVEIEGYNNHIKRYREYKQKVLQRRTELYYELKDTEDAIVGVFEAMVSIFTFGAYGSNIQLQALLYFSRLEYSRGEE